MQPAGDGDVTINGRVRLDGSYWELRDIALPDFAGTRRTVVGLEQAGSAQSVPSRPMVARSLALAGSGTQYDVDFLRRCDPLHLGFSR